MKINLMIDREMSVVNIQRSSDLILESPPLHYNVVVKELPSHHYVTKLNRKSHFTRIFIVSKDYIY